MNFETFGLDIRIMDGIDAMGYESPTPVQQAVIPEILSGRDVVACAQTGTGKTAAFLLPVIHHIISMPGDGHIRAIIIVPTRELAIQIAQQVDGFGYYTPVSSLAVYGGGTGPDYANEQRALKSGVDLVICTPGRMISHFNMGYVDTSLLKFLILDEADRMLDMGFFDDIMKIISFLPAERQSLLFSATMPQRIREMARRILNQPREINIALAKPPERISQRAYFLFEGQKLAAVKWLTENMVMKSIVIFCDTKIAVKQLARDLKTGGRSVEEIHSDLEQSQREEAMNRFKSRQTRILVATDIISRGIDVEDIDMIINFNVPHDAEDYVHRIGRTARAEAEGIAATLITPGEKQKLAAIEKLLGKEIPKLQLPDSVKQINPTQSDKTDRKPFGGRQKSTSGNSWRKRKN